MGQPLTTHVTAPMTPIILLTRPRMPGGATTSSLTNPQMEHMSWVSPMVSIPNTSLPTPLRCIIMTAHTRSLTSPETLSTSLLHPMEMAGTDTETAITTTHQATTMSHTGVMQTVATLLTGTMAARTPTAAMDPTSIGTLLKPPMSYSMDLTMLHRMP